MTAAQNCWIRSFPKPLAGLQGCSNGYRLSFTPRNLKYTLAPTHVTPPCPPSSEQVEGQLTVCSVMWEHLLYAAERVVSWCIPIWTLPLPVATESAIRHWKPGLLPMASERWLDTLSLSLISLLDACSSHNILNHRTDFRNWFLQTS